jgi:[ribosomal protein S5]-alanine N-acetyltransferase
MRTGGFNPIWILRTKMRAKTVNWALRLQKNQKLIGGIGFLNLKPGIDHKAELGYWLAKPYWNQGIMSKAVQKVCSYAFDELGLVRIAAHIFEFNTASAKVLEKCGFEREGYLHKYYKKEGKFFDGIAYGLIRRD